MLDKYRDFVGVEYEPPHGCFRLVSKVFEDVYGIDLGKQDEGLEQAQNKDRTARIQQKLIEMTEQVDNPQEGDLVIIRSRPFHIGVIIAPNMMLHAYNGGTSCIEGYEDMRWRNRVEGFYRYKGFSS
jgi:cell wall-associated NlpC family hydrolase